VPDRTLAEASSAKEDYTGHERDAETSLHDAGARYYMSALGRWTSVDPILQEQSATKLLEQDSRLLAMSPYNYTYDNPVNLLDPDGKCPTCPVGAIGAGVGYVGGFAINAVKQFYSDEYQKSGFNWRQANAAGVKGAIFGGVVGLTGGASLGVGATALAGAAGNTAGGVVERTIDGNKNTKAVDGRDMAQNAVVGGLGGAVAGTAAKTANDFGILVTGSPVSTTTSTLAGEVTSQSASLATDPIMEVVTDQLNPAEDLLRQYEPKPATTNEPLFNE
jgi:RHS repeat-associated protein